MPQFGDTLLLLAVVNLPVGDHVVQFVRQRLRFVPLAGGRHDRYGAEQQQGSQQVCGFQQFHGRGRPPQEASANRQKYNFLPNAGFLFNLSYLFERRKDISRVVTETKRRSGFRFGFQSENLLFTVQGTKNRRHTEQNGQKKESPATESPEIPGGNPPGGRHGTGCVPSRNSQAMSVESYPSFITSSMPISL